MQIDALMTAEDYRYFSTGKKEKKTPKKAKRQQHLPPPLVCHPIHVMPHPRPVFFLPTPPRPPMPFPVVFYTPQPEPTQVINPTFPVPYRGTPKYNTRRRMTNPILRRRSLSQSSICSAQSELYKVPQQIRQAPSISAPSPSPSSVTICASNASEYGTLRRYAPDAIQPAMAGFE